MKKWLAVAVLTVLALTGAVVATNLSASHAQVQTANGGGPIPPFPAC
jgi:hypothetical protein